MFLLLTDPGPAERFLTGWGQSKVGSDRSRQTLHKSSSRSSGVKVRLCNIFRFCAQVMKQSHGALVNKIVDIPVLSHKSRTGDTPSFHEAQHGYCMVKPALAMRKRSLDAQCKLRASPCSVPVEGLCPSSSENDKIKPRCRFGLGPLMNSLGSCAWLAHCLHLARGAFLVTKVCNLPSKTRETRPGCEVEILSFTAASETNSCSASKTTN